MSEILHIHSQSPQNRLIVQATKKLNQDKVVAYPTDSGYALGCSIKSKKALEKIRQIRKLPEKHNFTLICANLSEIGIYAKLDNTAYRTIKKLTPGPYTFIFEATKQVPNRLQQPKRKTIGIRVPNNKICNAMLLELNQPMMSVSLILNEDGDVSSDAESIFNQLKSKLDLIIDGGVCPVKPTTVVDFTKQTPEVLRFGQGDASIFE